MHKPPKLPAFPLHFSLCTCCSLCLEYFDLSLCTLWDSAQDLFPLGTAGFGLSEHFPTHFFPHSTPNHEVGLWPGLSQSVNQSLPSWWKNEFWGWISDPSLAIRGLSWDFLFKLVRKIICFSGFMMLERCDSEAVGSLISNHVEKVSLYYIRLWG